VTLIGQTVNSYLNQENGRAVRLAELLARVAGVRGIERVRFTTCYAGDFTDDIFEAMRDLPQVCEYLHLPVQSGSNAILKRMHRQYTVEQYIDLIDRGRGYVPGLAVASDFIVGFCGETEQDHEASLQLIERCRFKNIFVFKYSPRPGTVADRRDENDVADTIRRRRNADLLACQERVSRAANQPLVGRAVEVLVEGYSKAAVKVQGAEQGRDRDAGWRRSDQLVGRTRANQIVVFPGGDEHIGRMVRIRITAATALTLHGTFVENLSRWDRCRPSPDQPWPALGPVGHG
jgi:tRNA-2-methylthio-N6-dimethylallyladenosine synthase